MPPITVFRARRILTMNNYRPFATHVAVRDGIVLGAGRLEDVAPWGDYRLDEQFADKVLMPGFVEGHCHAEEGRAWEMPYVGYHDRRDPEGRLWPGLTTPAAVVERLREAQAAMGGDEALLAWGFDPIFFGGERVTRAQLDEVSGTRPILLMHASGHILDANSALLAAAGIDAGTDVEGVIKGADGEPTGELQEMAPMYMAFKVAGAGLFDPPTVHTLRRFAQQAVNAGVTTASDLYATLDEAGVATYREATAQAGFGVRLVPAMNALNVPLAEGVERLRSLAPTSTDRLHLGRCKIMTDGSIQGFTARLDPPGYFNGAANGLWNAPPQTLREMVRGYHAAGLQMHIHANGDEASGLMIDALADALAEHPRADHRHTLQHCQMASEAQMRRMAALGICVNLFANHLYYWGDQHAALTIGPDRAARMDAAATALATGVAFAIHCDAPVTPLAPLFTAWCAVNRLTGSGRVLGPEQRIPVAQALRAITLGAAYTLHLDHLLGSIEPGKYADFAVLGEDPLAVPPEALKDVPVWGTVLGGVPRPAARAT